MKRIISLLLAAVMTVSIFSGLQVSASAIETDSIYGDSEFWDYEEIELSKEAESIAHSLIADLEKNSKLTQAEKAVLVHDRLTNYLDFDLNYTVYSAEGAFLTKKSVCSGYSEAYQYLLHCLNIPCAIVSSIKLNHAWNVVLADGEPYFVDCTWDDPVCPGSGEGASGEMHEYCLCSQETFGHQADDWEVPFALNNTKYDKAFWKKYVATDLYVVGDTLYAYDYQNLYRLPSLSSKTAKLIKKGIDCQPLVINGNFYFVCNGNNMKEECIAVDKYTTLVEYYFIGKIWKYNIKQDSLMVAAPLKVYINECVKLSFKNGTLICKIETNDVVAKKRTVNIKNIETRANSSLYNAVITGIKNKTYTGKAITQSFTVKLGGKTLKKGKDFVVKYSANKKVGKVIVTITAKGNYYDSIKKTFSIVPKGTSLTKLTAGKKAFTAQWKKNASVNGYQVQYSLKSDFSGAKTLTLKNAKTLKATVKKLNAKKTYYVRIRTYKTVSKVNYFSAWSKTYKVKTK